MRMSERLRRWLLRRRLFTSESYVMSESSQSELERPAAGSTKGSSQLRALKHWHGPSHLKCLSQSISEWEERCRDAPLFLCLYTEKRMKRAKFGGQTSLTIPWIQRQSNIAKKLYGTWLFRFCSCVWFHGSNEHLKGVNRIKGNKKALYDKGFQIWCYFMAPQ